MNFERRIQCDTFVSEQTKRRFSHFLTKSTKETVFSFFFSSHFPFNIRSKEPNTKNNQMKRFVEYLSFGYAASMNTDLETPIQWLMPSFWSFYSSVFFFSLFVSCPVLSRCCFWFCMFFLCMRFFYSTECNRSEQCNSFPLIVTSYRFSTFASFSTMILTTLFFSFVPGVENMNFRKIREKKHLIELFSPVNGFFPCSRVSKDVFS